MQVIHLGRFIFCVNVTQFDLQLLRSSNRWCRLVFGAELRR